MDTFDIALRQAKTGEPIIPNTEILLFSSAVVNTIQRCSGDKSLDLDSFMKFSFNETMVKNLPALGVDKPIGIEVLAKLCRSYIWSVSNVSNESLMGQIKTKEDVFVASIIDLAFSLSDSIEIIKESFDSRDIYTRERLYKAVVEIKHNNNTWCIVTTDGRTSVASDYFINGVKRPLLSKNAAQVLSAFRFIAAALAREAMRRRAIANLEKDEDVTKKAKQIFQMVDNSYEDCLTLAAELSKCSKYIDSKTLKVVISKNYNCTQDDALKIIDIFKYPSFFD